MPPKGSGGYRRRPALGHESDRAALTQAVLEGVAFAFRDSQEALKAAGTKLDRVTALVEHALGDCHANMLAARYLFDGTIGLI